jgi:myo-inositol catabolism protein IolH
VTSGLTGKAAPGTRVVGTALYPQPAGTPARVHQQLDVGQGEVDWDLFFATLAEIGFDGIATVCVFARDERTRDSLVCNRKKVEEYAAKHGMETG